MGTHTFVTGLPNGILDNLGNNHTAGTGTNYTPATGILEITIGTHSLTTAKQLLLQKMQ